MLRAVPPVFDHQSKRPKSKFMNTRIDDLPDVLLIDILSRLACYKLVSQCKCVCKRWYKLIMYDNSLIGLFICRIRNDYNQEHPTPLRTLINQKGQSWHSSSKVLEKPVSFHSLEKELVVVATYNDLILCCATKYFQRDYFIFNPYTMQWVALPPPTLVLHHVPVGIICDVPFYNYEKEKHNNYMQHLVNIYDNYRCKVVRFLPYGETIHQAHWFLMENSFKFKVEIFSFETGEWRESVISSPRKFIFDEINSDINFAYNGMLYWPSRSSDANFLIGLNPFMINNDTDNNRTRASNFAGDGDGCYRCRFIELVVPIDKEITSRKYHIQCLDVREGCLHMCGFDSIDKFIMIWELKEDDNLTLATDGVEILCAKYAADDYSMEFSNNVNVIAIEPIAFDPNDEDILSLRLRLEYLNDDGDGEGVQDVDIDANLSTGNLTYYSPMMAEKSFYPLTVPLWPTPVPRLPHQFAASALSK